MGRGGRDESDGRRKGRKGGKVVGYGEERESRGGLGVHNIQYINSRDHVHLWSHSYFYLLLIPILIALSLLIQGLAINNIHCMMLGCMT